MPENNQFWTATGFLTDRKSGKVLQTKVSIAKYVEVKNLKKQGWNFDWKKPIVEGYEVYKITISGNDEIQGLIALKADEDIDAVYVQICESAPHNIGRQGKYEGIGSHLFAIAAKRSIESGFEGYVYFDAKTELIEHYKKIVDAIQVGNSQRMYIEPKAARKLIKKHLDRKGWENE
jgi:hypothetical protein